MFFYSRFLYDLNTTFEHKIETIAKEMYGAKSVEFSEKILEKLRTYQSKVPNLINFLSLFMFIDNIGLLTKVVKS